MIIIIIFFIKHCSVTRVKLTALYKHLTTKTGRVDRKLMLGVRDADDSQFFLFFMRQKFMEKRAESIRRDMQFCHPRWPEEKFYLESELSLLRDRYDISLFPRFNGW